MRGGTFNMADASNDSHDTAGIAAQKSSQESPKEEVTPEAEKKISDHVDPEASSSSTEPASKDDEKAELKREASKAVDPEPVGDEETVPAPVKVPRAKRRGLFGRFTFVAEVEKPMHYPRKVKWFITFNVAFAAIAAPMGSAIIFREPRSLPMSAVDHR